MRYVTECTNEECPDGIVNQGTSTLCPSCGGELVSTQVPDTAKDVATLRADYNRRNMHTPGFVPSVQYDKNGNKMVN